MDTGRKELSQVDQNSPEFRQALEIARQEVMAKASTEKDSLKEPDLEQSKPVSTEILGSKSSVLPEVAQDLPSETSDKNPANMLNRALEILQDREKLGDPHDLVDRLMQ